MVVIERVKNITIKLADPLILQIYLHKKILISNMGMEKKISLFGGKYTEKSIAYGAYEMPELICEAY